MERYNAELGYWIAEPYWNQGFMTKALKLAISDYFCSTDVVRIYANVYASNPASMRVLEKTGFRKCGIHKNACFKTGSLLTAIIMNCLKKTVCNCF